MSLHREMNYVMHRGPDDHRQTGWVGACECGWRGPDRWNGGETANGGADAASCDYRQHIEEVLGADAYYDASVACRNCGSHHRQGVLIGTHVTSEVCQRCGTRMLQPDNDVWEEDRARDHLWGGGFFR